MNICDNFLGEEPTTEKKRRGRKPKKQSEKSLLNTYFSEYPKEESANSKCDDSKEPGEKLQRPYENIKYMSQKDKSIFESKDISEQKMFRGMNRDGIKSASIYLSCRLNNNPRTPQEIAQIFKLDKTSATKGCSMAASSSLLGS